MMAAPSSAKRRHIACPRPPPPPVTTATLPSSLPMDDPSRSVPRSRRHRTLNPANKGSEPRGRQMSTSADNQQAVAPVGEGFVPNFTVQESGTTTWAEPGTPPVVLDPHLPVQVLEWRE